MNPNLEPEPLFIEIQHEPSAANDFVHVTRIPTAFGVAHAIAALDAARKTTPFQPSKPQVIAAWPPRSMAELRRIMALEASESTEASNEGSNEASNEPTDEGSK